MKVLLVGGGGREHALAWKIASSPKVSSLWCAPGNAGIALEPKTHCLDLGAEDVDGLVAWCRDQKPDLVVPGPEAPLVAGLVDRLEAQGVPCFGPTAAGARLEGSKVFAKEFMQQNDIPTARFEVFDSVAGANSYIEREGGKWVIKADGLAAGKGVVLCETLEEARQTLDRFMVDQEFGVAGKRVVIEELLEGEEVSCIAVTDGKSVRLLASSQDHKRVFDGDQGPNTGGMGAYSPAPVFTQELEAQVIEQVFQRVLSGMAREGVVFRGVLYAGLMLTTRGPMVLEFNVRLGDPEAQPLLARMQSDLVPLMQAVIAGTLDEAPLTWDLRPCVCVVMAAGGYPGKPRVGQVIEGIEEASKLADVHVFHAATRRQGNALVTSGGRVLSVCASGLQLKDAVQRAYEAVGRIQFEGAHWRRDIAWRALAR